MAAALALIAAAPAAAGERLTLRWTAPEGCPDAGKVEFAVNLLVGESGQAAQPLEVLATVSAQGAEWEVLLELAGTSRRVLRGRTCAAVADAAALIIALIIDPLATAQPLPPAQLPAPPPRREWRLGARAGLDWGALAAAGPAFGLLGSLSVGPQLFEVDLQAWVPQRVLLGAPAAAGGTLRLYLASVTTWRKLLDGVFSLGPSLGLDLGLLHAEGFGVTTNGSGSALWLAGRAGISASWGLVAPFELNLRLDLVVPVLRPRFVLTNVGDVHTPAPVGVRAMVGGAARFP